MFIERNGGIKECLDRAARGGKTSGKKSRGSDLRRKDVMQEAGGVFIRKFPYSFSIYISSFELFHTIDIWAPEALCFAF